ncbi:MAG TPA: helix-turn-helix domain-containing protein [Pseudogracilibacillus sp.]|nr:helix-turn-helix domain-containing protein [Pseudogracilibacillus sp.]
MKLIDLLILKSCKKIKNERTIYSVYHLFNGRSSIQTLQDAHLYKLSHLYGIYKNLTVKEFNEIILKLENKNLLKKYDDNNRFIITDNGIELTSVPIPLYFNGIVYEQYATKFNQRLLLFVQVWTNSNKENSNYIPVIDDFKTENFIKKLYLNRKSEVKLDLNKLFLELSHIFETINEHQRDFYIDRLSGYRNYGLSIQQLASKYKTDLHTINLYLESTNHIIIKNVLKKPKEYTILNLLLMDLLDENRLTKSARDTYQLFKQGYDLNDISIKRQLKLSTIYDHLVEIALYDQSFPINKFVRYKTQSEIIAYVNKQKTYKLKDIKENVSKEITYFQIRLVLSMMSNKEKSDLN